MKGIARFFATGFILIFMAASALSVQPQDAHAHDVTGAIDRQTTANVRRLIEESTKFSRAREGASDRIETTEALREPRIQQRRFNSSEGWGSAGLMGARKSDAEP